MAKYKIIPSSRTIVQSPISIGHKAEKGVEAIEFDLTAWVETYGSGTLTVIMRRWGDAIPYPIALEIDENNKATWTLSDIDTAKAGMAYAQLNYIVGDEVVKKSDIYTFRVMDSLVGEGEPPEAYEAWLEHLTHLAAEAMAEVLDIEGIVTDKTLTVDGGIADGKATGDALALKADKSTTYTKTEVDRMIEDVEVETGDELSALKADLGALTVTTVGTQLIDKTKAVSGFVTSSGNIDTSGSYSNYLTSDYIQVEANKTYTLYRAGGTGQITQTTRMAYCLFDSDKQALSYINNGSAVSLEITPTVDGYVRVTMTNNNINAQAMLIEGTNLVGYKAYTSETHLSDDVNPINTIGATYIRTQAINAAKAYRYGDTMTLVKNGNAVSVTYGRLTREYFIANGGNSVFNFSNAYLDNTLIKTSGDDITPQRILVNANSSATIGANHGWAYALRTAKGSFTRADEGSVWTDGTTEYTLIYVSDSYAFFVPPVSKSDGVIQITAIAPVSNLTHVSGSTHTDEVSLSGISKQQLYPSINEHAAGLYVNGDLVTADGTYDAGKLYIKEQYGIIDIYEWVTYARSHVGNINLDDMQTLCTITYVVEILKNAEIVYSNLRADTPITLVNSGFMQADPLSANDGVLYRYINGVSSGAFASTNLVDMTSYNTTNKIL